MTHLIINSQDYREIIDVTPVKALPGQYHLKITSQLLSAKNPESVQVKYTVTTDRAGLEEIALSIYEAILTEDQ